MHQLNLFKAQNSSLSTPGLVPVLEALPRPPPHTILELPLLCLSAVKSLGHGLNVSVERFLIRLSKLLPCLTDKWQTNSSPSLA
jgi:hypothetical protein